MKKVVGATVRPRLREALSCCPQCTISHRRLSKLRRQGAYMNEFYEYMSADFLCAKSSISIQYLNVARKIVHRVIVSLHTCSTSPNPHGVSRERTRNDSSENLLVQSQPQKTSRSKKNINMMAAFSHILGDTLRTVAEFMAALVSTITGIDGDECDVSHLVYVYCWC